MSCGTRSLATLEIVGGSPCLDFTNTVNSRHTWDHEYLTTYIDLIAWGQHTGALTRHQAKRLATLAGQRRRAADAIHNRAVNLRETTYAVFAAIAGGRQPPPDDLATLSATYAAAMARAQIVSTLQGYRESWPPDRDLEAVIWPIAHATGRLLLHDDDIRQVKECPGCGWLFLDTSRNRRRRWCSMHTCGSRDKMRRYYHSKRAGRP